LKTSGLIGNKVKINCYFEESDSSVAKSKNMSKNIYSSDYQGKDAEIKIINLTFDGQ
jgi:hypothetical protein